MVARHMGDAFSTKALKGLEAMDEPANIPRFYLLGRLAGRQLVRVAYFGDAFDMQTFSA